MGRKHAQTQTHINKESVTMRTQQRYDSVRFDHIR